jgi:DNA-directed RNA polymerase subunit RPC12/RpoP
MSSLNQQSSPVSLALIDIELEESHRLQRQAEIIAAIAEEDAQITERAIKRCPECGSRMHRHGKSRPRELWTRAGMVLVSLTKVRCPDCHYLATPAHALIGDGLLSSVAQQFIELCRKNSFATSAMLLNKLLGINIPVMTLHSYVRRQADFFDDAIVTETEALYAEGVAPATEATLKPGAPLYLAIDEGLMHEWTYCHVKKKRDRSKKFVTAHCAVFFDGRRRISGKKAKPRYALTNRFGHASATTDTDQFFCELVTLSYKRGYTDAHPLFILSDGARYIAGGIETHFPQSIHLLDIFHLKSRVAELIDEPHPLYERSQEAIRTYDPSLLLAVIDAVRVYDEPQRELKKKLYGYVLRNAQAIYNHRDPRTRVHGSASAEKAVDLLIARRFKNRGMSWTEPGCEVLLQFQVLDYNGRLESFWNDRHAQIPALCDVQREETSAMPQTPSPIARNSVTRHPDYYHQVHLIDCERTKGANLN